MSKIKLLSIATDRNGVGKYRTIDPYIMLNNMYGDMFHVDVVFDMENNDDKFKGYDVVIFHNFIHKTTHEENLNRIKWLKKNNIKVIMDVDDYWSLDPEHPMYLRVKTNNFVKQKIELMKEVDYITTTTEKLSDIIRKNIGIKNVEVLPNGINSEENQFISKKTESDKIRFGWSGGSTHMQDIKLLKRSIQLFYVKEFKNFQFVLCGFDTRGIITIGGKTRDILPHETVWVGYEKIFTENYKHLSNQYRDRLLKFQDLPIDSTNEKYVRVWTKPINNYAENYNDIDISLVPLKDTLFNRLKSPLKLIESGFHKTPVICSNIDPYRDDLVPFLKDGKLNEKGNSLLVDPYKNDKGWFKNMKYIMENPETIKVMGENLYETVKDKYSLKNITEKRKDFLKQFINN